MRKTYAYNGITLGIVLGFCVGLLAKSSVVCVIAMIAFSFIGFVAIRFLENAVSAGVDKAATKITQKIHDHKDNK